MTVRKRLRRWLGGDQVTLGRGMLYINGKPVTAFSKVTFNPEKRIVGIHTDTGDAAMTPVPRAMPETTESLGLPLLPELEASRR